MPRNAAVVAALLPPLVSAHFSILHPPTAFVLAGEQATTSPCGYGTPPDPQASAHPYLSSGSQIALSTHGDSDWTIQYTLDPVPAAPGSGGNWSEMIAPIETEGDGNFCITTAAAAASAAGSKGWVSIRGEMAEGTYYQCAYVNFVNVTTLEFPVVCANSTGVKVGYDTGDDEDDTTTSTTTSTRYTNSSTTKTTTSTGITSTSAGTTTLTGTNTSTTYSIPSPTDDDDGDDGDDNTPTPTPTGDQPPPTDTDAPPQPTDDGPTQTGGDDGDDDGAGPSTITSTTDVVPTQSGEGQTGTATSSGAVQVPTGAAVNTKGSPLGMAGFSAVVLGAGILCAGLLA